jgi:hypothetical protein
VAAERRADIARLGLPTSATPVIGLIEVATAGVLIAAVAADEPDLARLGAALLVVTSRTARRRALMDGSRRRAVSEGRARLNVLARAPVALSAKNDVPSDPAGPT